MGTESHHTDHADDSALSAQTVAVSAGRPPRAESEPVNPPIVLSSTYFSREDVQPGRRLYTRMGTETWEPFEAAVAALEMAEQPAVVFSSGMAAIAAALCVVPAGGKVVVPRHAYQVTLGLLDDLAQRFGVEVVRVDIADTAAVVAELTGTDVLWIESPTNPMLEIADLPALIAAGHAADAHVMVDNTFATPLVQQPLNLGADVVVHSASKYLAGHSDVILGIAVSNDAELSKRLRGHRSMYGAIAGPFEVWLALRGLRTLALRVERSQDNALELAARLAKHPEVLEVRHPSLPDDPGHERARSQMTGFGSVLGVRPRGGRAQADDVVERVALWIPATSLGGVESTLERRRRFGSESKTVPDDLLRLSVGIENIDDLWNDLDRALRGV